MTGSILRKPRGWLVALVAGWFGMFALFPELYRFVGLRHYGVWFLDTFAILASNDAVARGLDPYAANPLDYFNRPHVYTHWWLGLREFGLTRAHNFELGLALVLGFLATALVFLRPRSGREVAWSLAILGSPPVLLACNRANNDLLIFILLAAVVPCLLDSRRLVRLSATGFIVVAAGLKYFPAVAGLLLLAGPMGEARERRVRLAIGCMALVWVAVDLAPDLAAVGGLAPMARGLITFGAVHLPTALGFGAGETKGLILIAVVAATVFFWRCRWFEGWSPAVAENRERWHFVLGAALLTGCFFTGTSYGYRWVFAVWLAPWVWRVARDAAAPSAVRKLGAITGMLLLFSLWADSLVSAGLGLLAGRMAAETAVAVAEVFFVAEQPLTWALFLCLLAFLTRFVREGLGTLWTRA